ncbi:very long-chain acyl-CoA synthetase isoform X1, partial [Candidatus Magnetomorum sp. HK-1]
LVAANVEKLIIDENHLKVIDANIEVESIFILGDTNVSLPEYVCQLGHCVDSDIETESPYPVNPGFADDTAMLIFTSGTTGLPKAVKITNRRWCLAALASAAGGNIKPRDTIYCCLPLYHSSAMLILVGGAVIGGSRLAIAPRFSMTSFWDDIRNYGVTVVGYIGELCRYLLNSPPGEKDTQHSVRLFMGNGMQKNVWEKILQRFKPDRVLEFYASTEGNMILANLTGKKVGSVGRPIYDPGRVVLIKYDAVNGKIIKDEKNKVIPCGNNETGLLIARIDKSHPVGYFDGYINDDETQKTILKDIFSPGDAWFVSGDLLKRDKDGDYWYVDRIGNTFRWKSENISTTLVENVLAELSFVSSVAVYGAKLPGREGRVGVAALELLPGKVFDGKALFNFIHANLSKSAHPRVIRIVNKIKKTDTLRVIKYQLQKEGLDPKKIQDPLYLYEQDLKDYIPLMESDYPLKVD